MAFCATVHSLLYWMPSYRIWWGGAQTRLSIYIYLSLDELLLRVREGRWTHRKHNVSMKRNLIIIIFIGIREVASIFSYYIYFYICFLFWYNNIYIRSQIVRGRGQIKKRDHFLKTETSHAFLGNLNNYPIAGTYVHMT